MSIERVCVLGGSGFVGRHVVHRLHKHGYKARVVTRDIARNRDMRVMPGVEVVEGNPLRRADLDRHLEGADAVINLVGTLTEKRPGRQDYPLERRGDFHAVHVELPRLVVKAAKQAGIRRVLHMSANGADPLAPSQYQRSKGLGAQILREASEVGEDGGEAWLNGPKMTRGEGLDVTIFEPSIIFGEGDGFFTRFAKLVRRIPVVFPLPRGETRFAPVWVEDVAEVFAKALGDPRTYGQTYALCGPHEYTFADLVRFIARLEGVQRQVWPVPEWLSWVQAAFLERVPGKPLTRDQLLSLSEDNTCSEPFPEIFGVEPRTLEAVVPTYIGRQESSLEDLYKYRAAARRK
ncbi:complex I NDUFA9 subunit family protein [Thiohalorhabdus sp. Cl-TMA]|uniref:Complex I NDUFA9 subunit family protein n=1 Tax=Thiohalorhabdus methylotrophus TaxID=3242694 RepID=A0ABV4TW11_9GAMM